jgi:uncharacterized protein with NRDE domain
MCLVSYIPIGNNHFCITSNRDEAPARAAYDVQTEKVGEETIYYPADTKGGSWIIVSDKGRAICLLNGAFVKHKRNLPYRQSRGVVMKQYFQYDSAPDFLEQINLNGIEPFTMVIADQQYLFELRWDEEVKHIKTLDRAEAYVWSSCTLYGNEAIRQRSVWFYKELNKVERHSPETIVNIHRAGGEKDRSIGFLMNWDDQVRTISISQIKSSNSLELLHIPLEAQTLEPIHKLIYG